MWRWLRSGNIRSFSASAIECINIIRVNKIMRNETKFAELIEHEDMRSQKTKYKCGESMQ